jgi:TolB-like protein/tRNA A-37 threonylcarbamoyl transferase component Bud32/Flp pilus assembly protein TadD
MARKCPRCNTKNPDDSKYCKECAASLDPSKEVSVTKTLQTPLATPGKIIAGKYKILSEIGRGGMGVVYKAKDTKLKRNVALKFLPAELIQDKESKKRFIREAQAAAALEHPNICTVHEVDDSEYQTFIAMSYIEGESLKDRLKENPLEIDEAKDIIFQVAEGLKEAHEKGIVHRDIKPANIMVTKKGQVKITDFGLAKLSWGVDLTKTSTIMGTVAYMSPEQARGEEIDHRTDIWSLGVMLYEMLTGERPFIKDHEQALIYSILNDEPKSVSSLRSEIPSYLESTIQKALEKDVTKRFQSVDEFIEAVKHPIAISTPKDDKSIAVLPFTNMSADPEQEYFCDGIAEEIINSLTKLKDLHVVARTSAFSFKGKNVKVQDIGNQLNVGYVLEGSVRKSGNKLRVTAQLINVTDGYHLWSDRYDRDLEDIFAIQDEISLAIVDKLKLKLFKEEKAELIKHPTRDIEVYNLYLRGRYHWQRFTVEDLKKSQKYFERAIELDPDYALPYAELAGGVYMQLAGGGQDLLPPKETMPKAKDLLEKAIEKDPNNGEALSYMGLIHTWYEYDWKAAEEMLKRANEVDPGWVSHNGYAFFLTRMGRLEEAIEEQIKAIELDPLSPLMYNNAGHFCYDARQYDRALEYCQLALDLNPQLPITNWVMGLIHIQKKNYKRSIELIKPLVSDLTYTYGFLGYAYGKAKMTEEAGEILNILNGIEEKYQVDPLRAMIYCGLGETDKAFEYLELSTNELPIAWSKSGFVVTYGMFGVDPIWDPLRKDDRFVKILDKVGLSHLAPKKEIKADTVSAVVSSQKFEKSIVVLPFDDVSPGKDNEYFSDGMTEEIISDLSKIQSLRVISRTSAMMLKSTRKSMKTIARELDVQYVLEGSVRKAGNNLRITSQLIDAKSDAHLWAEKYSGTLDDVFDIQEKVSHSIVEALKIRLSPEENQNITERPIDNVLAYEHYLKARHEIMAFTEEGFGRAMEYLQKGLRIVGENTLILRGIGFARFQQLNIGLSSDRTLVKEIETNAERILKWDSKSPHGYFLKGCVGVLRGNFIEAVKQWRRAYRIDPHDPETMLFLGAHSLSTGQPKFARKLFDTLVTIDPLVPLHHILIPYADFYLGRPSDNLGYLRKAVEIGSDVPLLMLASVRVLAAAGETDEASSVAALLNNEHPMTMFSQLSNVLILGLQGHKEEALNQITNELLEFVQHDCEWASILIECYALIGENEKALELLEHSIDGGLINYPFLNEYDPFLENIRSEPRFKKLMERVKHEWENFEV